MAKKAAAKNVRAEKKVEQEKEIVIVIDRSGSMSGQEAEVEGGLQTFLDEQKEHNPKAKVTLAHFDDHYELLFGSAPLNQVKFTHQPRGMTALLDAIGKTATDAHDRFMKHKGYPDVLLVVITDGLENSSQEFTKESLKSLMDKLKNKYDWDDLFIGAKFDNFSDAHSFGTQTVATAAAQSVGTAFTNVSAYYIGTRNVGLDRTMTKAHFKSSTEADEELDVDEVSTSR
jgi:hypothetical protein